MPLHDSEAISHGDFHRCSDLPLSKPVSAALGEGQGWGAGRGPFSQRTVLVPRPRLPGAPPVPDDGGVWPRD